ncbi:hypothetical protein HNQ91_003513 [Filimonas zeae]|nr:glycoside hydrolase family 97 protein [Filimonas zeae]MDR6340448.1 hypothetical protein [Filimonas zeae]
MKRNMRWLAICVALLANGTIKAQQATITSPDQKISVQLMAPAGSSPEAGYLKVRYTANGKTTEAIPRIDLGLVLNNQDYAKALRFIKAGKPTVIREQYTALHGKKLNRSNTANEVVLTFDNAAKNRLNLIVRAYNDGIAFRYELPEKQGSFTVNDELTAYTIAPETTRWMEKWNPANEGLYTAMSNDKVQQQEWCYPALFNTGDSACWFLLHESDVNRSYCGSKLSNLADKASYKITFPDPKDGRGKGESAPTISLPWKSPWRVVIMGSLADVVASTLVEDVAPASVLPNTAWVKPGMVSWNYWSDNHGTKDYNTVCRFADLAATMHWPYTLLDWEWDAMGNGGKLEDALTYIKSKGIKPLMWYNSGGDHTWVSATPKDRMLTHENRVAEFTKLKQLGVAGVKIDFFESEKQDMIRYYLDILDDAAQFEMMVYFHGCIVPRGWSRTYPHLMTYEAVRGAEWYNNGPEFTYTAPEHNTILPFTRNVIGPMDYTPVTFTNSQYPHITSYGHELALSVLFESGMQHLADRPEGYYQLPDAPKNFLQQVPNTWDETRLVDGYPGKEVTLARRKGNNWYIAGVNAELKEKRKSLPLTFLPGNTRYQVTLIADGKHDKDFSTTYSVTDSTGKLNVKLLRRGGFAAVLTPIQ